MEKQRIKEQGNQTMPDEAGEEAEALNRNTTEIRREYFAFCCKGTKNMTKICCYIFLFSHPLYAFYACENHSFCACSYPLPTLWQILSHSYQQHPPKILSWEKLI